MLLGLALAPDAHARPFDLAGRDWEGCADLVDLARAELGAKVVVTSDLDFRELRPGDGLLLLYPENTVDADTLSRFMRAGGRVILLDDFGAGDGVLAHFGMERVPIPRRPADTLRHNPQLAIAEPASLHPVVADVQRIVTNHPTGLKHPDLSPVLRVRGVGEPDVIIAVAGAVGQGRLLVVGDPSIVMNAMLRYGGNKALARGLVRYAVDDDTWGSRGGRLFIASGAFRQQGTFGDDDALSALRDKLRVARDTLAAMRREGMPAWLLFGASVALGLALVTWTGSRAGRVHKPLAPRFSRAIPLVAQGGLAGHAAVVASPTATRLIALLELKYALEEKLTALLGLEGTTSHEALLGKVEAGGVLDARTRQLLRSLLARFAGVETVLLFGKKESAPSRVSDAEVIACARDVRVVLEAAERAAAKAGRRAET